MMILNHLTLTLCSEDTSEGSVGQGVLKMDSINKRADLSDELQWESLQARVCTEFGRDPKVFVPTIHRPAECGTEYDGEDIGSPISIGSSSMKCISRARALRPRQQTRTHLMIRRVPPARPMAKVLPPLPRRYPMDPLLTSKSIQ